MIIGAVLCVLPQCGLEYLPFLKAPADPDVRDADKIFEFTRTNTELEFRGYELYYKFYTIDQDPNTTITTLAGLKADTFQRMSNATDTETKPLIQIPLLDVTAYTFTLLFNQFPTAADPRFVSSPSGITGQLRRSTVYGSTQGNEPGFFKHFPESVDQTDQTYELDDEDIESQVWAVINSDPPGDNVRLAVYALSYGLKDYTSPLYSDAVYLGDITINFGW